MTERRKRVSPYFYPNMRALRFLGHDVGYGDSPLYTTIDRYDTFFIK